jgi:hypothetical protein
MSFLALPTAGQFQREFIATAQAVPGTPWLQFLSAPKDLPRPILRTTTKSTWLMNMADKICCVSTTSRPTRFYAGGDPGPGGTPAGTASLYSSFAGLNPNGNWQLYINDDAFGDAGFLSSWCLKFNTIVLQLTNAVSRKSHNGTTFDIDLPLTGNPGIECRTSAGGNHTLVFTLTTNVVSGSATLTSGTGTAGAASFSGNTMTVPLTGVADQQKITVTLNGVTDASSQVLPATSVSMIALLGDTTANKSVTLTIFLKSSRNRDRPRTRPISGPTRT